VGRVGCRFKNCRRWGEKTSREETDSGNRFGAVVRDSFRISLQQIRKRDDTTTTEQPGRRDNVGRAGPGPSTEPPRKLETYRLPVKAPAHDIVWHKKIHQRVSGPSSTMDQRVRDSKTADDSKPANAPGPTPPAKNVGTLRFKHRTTRKRGSTGAQREGSTCPEMIMRKPASAKAHADPAPERGQVGGANYLQGGSGSPTAQGESEKGTRKEFSKLPAQVRSQAT